MLNRLVVMAVCVVCLGGCQPRQETTSLELPANVEEAVGKLRELEIPIVTAMRAGDPSACDEELHSAMFLADQLPDIANKNAASADNLQEVTDAAKKLSDLLMAAHEGSHGGSGSVTDGEEFATEIDTVLQAIEAAIP